jgi:hypothetical protein
VGMGNPGFPLRTEDELEAMEAVIHQDIRKKDEVGAYIRSFKSPDAITLGGKFLKKLSVTVWQVCYWKGLLHQKFIHLRRNDAEHHLWQSF